LFVAFGQIGGAGAPWLAAIASCVIPWLFRSLPDLQRLRLRDWVWKQYKAKPNCCQQVFPFFIYF